MRETLIWIEIIIAIVLTISVLFQESKTSPTPSYGNLNHKFKPRGKEAFFNNLTKISGALFLLNAILILKFK